MAYATSNPPVRIAGAVSGASIWYYTDADVDSDVDLAGYFTDGKDLGMKVGDILFHFDTAGVMTPFFVSAIESDDGATVISQQFV